MSDHDHENCDHAWFHDLSEKDQGRVTSSPKDIMEALQARELSAAPVIINGMNAVALTIEREEEESPEGFIAVYPVAIVVTEEIENLIEMPGATRTPVDTDS